MHTGAGTGNSDSRLHSRKRTSRKIEKKAHRHTRLRRFYFSVAALWGFVLGAGFLAIALKINATEIPKDPKTLGMVVCGAVLSVLGGLMAAQAYREYMGR